MIQSGHWNHGVQTPRSNVAHRCCQVLHKLGKLDVEIGGTTRAETEFRIIALEEKEEKGEAILETPIDGYCSLF